MSESAKSMPETSSGSPGSILRRCREFHGFTIEEASEATKIGISHLTALEEDRIRDFANQAYLKGFLRIYATYLGLNSDDISRMYDKLFGVKSEKGEPERTPAPPLRIKKGFALLKKLIFPASLLVAILITATFFKRPPPPPLRQTPIPVTAPNAAQIPPVQSVGSSSRVKNVVRAAPRQKKDEAVIEASDKDAQQVPKRTAEASRGFVLKVKASQAGTLNATVDGTAVQQYDLTVGDVIEWKAERKVALELSNAGGVDVELNGKPHKALGPSGKPGYFELGADGVR